MKRYLRWLCPVFFLAAVSAVICGLYLFVRVDDTIQYIDWDSSVQISEDGTEQAISTDISGNDSGMSGTYRFTGTLPEGVSAGSLLFETTGLELTLSLNGEEIWSSSAELVEEGSHLMSQAVIPLPEGTSGELVFTCTILDEDSAIFPPLIRFVPDSLELKETAALANREAFTAGAAALAFLLVFGLFLTGIVRKKPDWSLIPLLLALAGLSYFRLIQSQGYYFLPEKVYQVLGRPEIGVLIIIVLLLYLVMNRRRRFWQYLGIAAGWSAGAFVLWYLISLAAGSDFSSLVNIILSQLIQTGYYDSVVYWITLWLALTCALISAYGVARSFADQEVQTQGLLLKNQLLTDNYHALEERIAENAALRHEIRHQLTALDCLCRNDDFEGVKETLAQMLDKQKEQPRIRYTENAAINTILLDAAGKAARQNIGFQAYAADIPEDLNIPEADLCLFLMNILENALDGAKKVSAQDKRYVNIRVRIADLYLAVRCENSFDGKLREDKNGELLTTKEDTSSHGFGWQQIKKIAEKYQSGVRFAVSNGDIFVLQTALRIPER